MKRKSFLHVLAVTVPLVCVMIAVLLYAFAAARDVMTKSCFEALEYSARHVAVDLSMEMERERSILRSMASHISKQKSLDWESLRDTMAFFDGMHSYISHVELLTPDGRLLHQNGTAINVGDRLSFADEASKGDCVSGPLPDRFAPSNSVGRSAVPVIRNGATVAILYGVVSLRQLSQMYKTDEYGGKTFVYLIDGDTGEFLIDTWHRELGNINEFGKRSMLYGYDFPTFLNNLKEGRAGHAAFVSNITKKPLYLHYMPLGINNWNVMISVPEEVAFASYKSVNNILLKATTVEIGMLLFYLAYIIVYFFRLNRRVEREERRDPVTQCQNRNAYEKRMAACRNSFFASLSCCYVDVNGLHELNNEQGHAAGDVMLRNVGDCLKRVFPYQSLYRVGGDEFVIFSEENETEAFRKKVGNALEEIQSLGHSVSVGLVHCVNETGLEQLVKKADKEMLENKRRYYFLHDRRTRHGSQPRGHADAHV